MARNIVLSLGLVTVPVKLDTAVTDSTPSFKTVCDGPGTKKGHAPTAINSKYICPSCGNDERHTMKKASPTDDGKYIVIDAETVKAEMTVPDSVKQKMDLAAHPVESVLAATLPTGKVYNLLPGKGVDENLYALFVEAVKQAQADGLALCTIWAYRDKPVMYMLGHRNTLLIVQELAWPADVKDVAPITGTPDKAMLEQFKTLIGMSKSDFDADAYKDFRAESVAALLAKGKAVEAGDEPTGPTVQSGGTNVADQLAAALKGAEKAEKASKKKAS